MDTQPNHKLVVKNATMLTIRMIIVTLVGLYTSRVVFAQLGDVNYGIYGVVGGILGFLSFLTTSMAGASSRFITYAIGSGNKESINEIFNASFWIHCVIALIVIIIGETFGVWFLNNILSIPPERLDAAWWVFQFSIISSAVTITQVPYTAVIMAYEKMSIYAYVELVNVALKLVVVYLLSIAPYDKLVVYAFLLMVVSLVIALFYRFYCICIFNVCRLHIIKDFRHIKRMLSFSMMDLYGNIGVTVNSQGLTYAINIFFGVVYNAAVTLANTVNGMILSLTTTIAIAFKPQIIKQYAQGCIDAMEQVMINSVKFTLIAMALISIPCAIEAEYVIRLWLGEVPEFSAEFLRILIIQSFFPVINNVCNAAIHATGNIKKLTFINGTIFFIMPFIIFLVFYLGANVLWGYGIEILGMIIIIIIANIIVNYLIDDFKVGLFMWTIAKCFLVIIISMIPALCIYEFMPSNLIRVILVVLSYGAILSLLSWNILLTLDNRMLLINKVCGLFRN